MWKLEWKLDKMMKWIFYPIWYLLIIGTYLAIYGFVNEYNKPFAIVDAILLAIAVVLIIIYTFVEGKEYLKYIALALAVTSFIIHGAFLLLFTQNYSEPYNYVGRARPIRSEFAKQVVTDIRKEYSAEKLFNFDIKSNGNDEENYSADVTVFFRGTDINGSYRTDYSNNDNYIVVQTEYRYLDNIVKDRYKESTAKYLKNYYIKDKYYYEYDSNSFYESTFDNQDDEYQYDNRKEVVFSEKDFTGGTKYGIEYQYMLKKLPDKTRYLFLFMRDEDTFFTSCTKIPKELYEEEIDAEKTVNYMLKVASEKIIRN